MLRFSLKCKPDLKRGEFGGFKQETFGDKGMDTFWGT